MEYGCIGEHLKHSFSKEIHNRLTDYEYEIKEIPREELKQFMFEKNFKAINVTIPYKQDVIKYLDFISDTAKEIGAVNTIVNKNGKLFGYNTDYLGMNLLIEKNGISLADKKVLILGSGGTSKTAYCVAKNCNANEVIKVSRTKSVDTITYDEAVSLHSDAQVIINTTPCGMYPKISGMAIDPALFPQLYAVVDAVYNPLRTDFYEAAVKHGAKACCGLFMLVAQAAFAVEKFLDIKISTEKIDTVYNDILRNKTNIVFIGMPACGKTTIGQILGKNMNREVYDTDELIINTAKTSIPDIFTDIGECGFRKIESDVIKEISAKSGVIISTGGGAVLNKDNIRYLKKNGFVVFLDRSLDLLITSDDRPLSSNRDDLKKRYEERYDLYCTSADYIVDANQPPNVIAAEIERKFFSENFSD